MTGALLSFARCARWELGNSGELPSLLFCIAQSGWDTAAAAPSRASLGITPTGGLRAAVPTWSIDLYAEAWRIGALPSWRNTTGRSTAATFPLALRYREF